MELRSGKVLFRGLISHGRGEVSAKDKGVRGKYGIGGGPGVSGVFGGWGSKMKGGFFGVEKDVEDDLDVIG